jgi:hypothetical protein
MTFFSSPDIGLTAVLVAMGLSPVVDAAAVLDGRRLSRIVEPPSD